MEPSEAVEDLRREFLQAQAAGDAAVDSFFAGLAARPVDPGHLVEFAIRVMESFRAEDGFLVAEGCRRILLARAGPAEGDRVRSIRSALPPLEGALGGRDYRADWDQLVALVEGRGRGACDCEIRSSFGPPPHDPAYEIVKETPSPAGSIYRVRCRACGKDWEVEVDLSYHYPHAYWRLA